MPSAPTTRNPGSPGSPRVSILIPNFNNGRQSSKTGNDDLLGRLLQSLWDTLNEDPTPFEIIAYDDGSTDDSLQTLRTWAARTWPNGSAFLELIEAPHCGYLSRTANVLCRKARGQFLARLDGDIVCITPRWVSLLCQAFDTAPPELGILGPKQLRPDGKIHAYGDFVIHPNGYLHVGFGLERNAVTKPLEVDHIMGCFHCCRKAVYESVGGYDERFLRGQTEDLGLMALLQGWRAAAIPFIEFVHFHGLRLQRETEADAPEGILKTLKIFEEKWGFSRLSPDMDDVRRRYAGTPLLWNRALFDPPAVPRLAPPLTFETSLWTRFTKDPSAQQAVQFRIGVLTSVIQQAGKPKRPVMLGCAEGLEAHLLAAKAGVGVLGFDDRPECIALARRCTATQKYPAEGAALRFEHLTDLRRLPLADTSTDLLVIMDLLERHPNPVVLLREAHRVLTIDGLLVIITRRMTPKDAAALPTSGYTPTNHPYLWTQLKMQVRSIRGFNLLVDEEGEPTRDMALVARRLDCELPVMPTVSEVERLLAERQRKGA